MTISTEACKMQAIGNGVQTQWDYKFTIPGPGYASVWIYDADGTLTPVPPSNYILTGLGDPDGGQIIYPIPGGPPLANGRVLTLLRSVPYVQPTDFSFQSSYSPETAEGADDYLDMQIQQLLEKASRAIRIAVNEGPLPDLPTAPIRAGKYLWFNGQGMPDLNVGPGFNNATMVDNIAQLRALPTPNLGEGAKAVYVKGYYLPGDGGGGWFIWQSYITDDDDAGIYIQPDSLPPVGRWRREHGYNYMSVNWWGAFGDGFTDVTTQMKAAATFWLSQWKVANDGSMNMAAPTGPALHIPGGKGEYIVSDTWMVQPTTNPPQYRMLHWMFGDSPSASQIQMTDPTKWHYDNAIQMMGLGFKNLTFINGAGMFRSRYTGNCVGVAKIFDTCNFINFWRTAIEMNSSDNPKIQITNCTFMAHWQSTQSICVALMGGLDEGVIEDCEFTRAVWGIKLARAAGLTIARCRFLNWSMSRQEGGVFVTDTTPYPNRKGDIWCIPSSTTGGYFGFRLTGCGFTNENSITFGGQPIHKGITATDDAAPGTYIGDSVTASTAQSIGAFMMWECEHNSLGYSNNGGQNYTQDSIILSYTARIAYEYMGPNRYIGTIPKAVGVQFADAVLHDGTATQRHAHWAPAGLELSATRATRSSNVSVGRYLDPDVMLSDPTAMPFWNSGGDEGDERVVNLTDNILAEGLAVGCSVTSAPDQFTSRIYAIAWNPAGKAASLNLSNGNRDVAATLNTAAAVRATAAQATMTVWGAILQFAGATPAGFRVGLGTAATSLAAQLGTSADAYAIDGAGLKWNNNVSTATGTGFDTGTLVMVAYRSDISGGAVWFGINGSWIGGGNPATGTNPAFTGVPAGLFPMISTSLTGQRAQIITTRNQWPISYPTGFGPCDTTSVNGNAVEITFANSTGAFVMPAALGLLNPDRPNTLIVPMRRANSRDLPAVTVGVRDEAADFIEQKTYFLSGDWKTYKIPFGTTQRFIDNSALLRIVVNAPTDGFVVGVSDRVQIGKPWIVSGRETKTTGHAGTNSAGRWNTGHWVMGNFHLWVDLAANVLRIKDGQPLSDTDGKPVDGT
jgi:hypothetical protein